MMPLSILRLRLVKLSTASIFATIILLFAIKMIVRIPLSFDDLLRAFLQLLPIFLGFFVSAVVYVFRSTETGTLAAERFALLNFIMCSSFAAYWAGILGLFSLYAWSHSEYAQVGSGMTTEVFFGFLTALVSIVTMVVGGISTELFFERDELATTSRIEQPQRRIAHPPEVDS